uniref:Uncharacterized protein n=1 Tax=Fagus sylvatica TaxID=28930 RepID=A0A2N9IL10_FAGSY
MTNNNNCNYGSNNQQQQEVVGSYFLGPAREASNMKEENMEEDTEDEEATAGYGTTGTWVGAAVGGTRIKPELMKAVLLVVKAMVENLRSVKLAFKDWRPTKLAIEDRRLVWVAIVVEGIAAMVVLERVVIDTRMSWWFDDPFAHRGSGVDARTRWLSPSCCQ